MRGQRKSVLDPPGRKEGMGSVPEPAHSGIADPPLGATPAKGHDFRHATGRDDGAVRRRRFVPPKPIPGQCAHHAALSTPRSG